MSREILLTADGGDAIWFVGTLMIIKATKEETGDWSLIDWLMPAGSSPPTHIHRDEDEAFYVMEGRAPFYLDDEPFEGGPGSFVFLPRGVKHTFQVDPSGPARFMIVTSPEGNFEKFIREMGTPAQSLTLPPLEEPLDEVRLAATMAKYDMDVVGPPAGEL